MDRHYLTRTLEASITKANAHFPMLMLSGPRQVGKTTLLKTLCDYTLSGRPPRRVVALDNPMLLALAREGCRPSPWSTPAFLLP